MFIYSAAKKVGLRNSLQFYTRVSNFCRNLCKILASSNTEKSVRILTWDMIGIYVCHWLKFTTPNQLNIQLILHILDTLYIQIHTEDFMVSSLRTLLVYSFSTKFLASSCSTTMTWIITISNSSPQPSQTRFYPCIMHIKPTSCCHTVQLVGYDRIYTWLALPL